MEVCIFILDFGVEGATSIDLLSIKCWPSTMLLLLSWRKVRGGRSWVTSPLCRFRRSIIQSRGFCHLLHDAKLSSGVRCFSPRGS